MRLVASCSRTSSIQQLTYSTRSLCAMAHDSCVPTPSFVDSCTSISAGSRAQLRVQHKRSQQMPTGNCSGCFFGSPCSFVTQVWLVLPCLHCDLTIAAGTLGQYTSAQSGRPPCRSSVFTDLRGHLRGVVDARPDNAPRAHSGRGSVRSGVPGIDDIN